MAIIHLHHGEQDGIAYEGMPEEPAGIYWVPSYAAAKRVAESDDLDSPLDLIESCEMEGFLPYVFARMRHLEDGTEVHIYEFCEELLIRDDNRSA